MIKLKKKVKGYVENYLKQVDDNGFSLLELVVAVGILLILTVGGLLAYNGLTKNARVAAVQSAADEVLTGAVAADVQGKSKQEIEAVGDEWTNTGKGVITTTVDASDRTCIVVEAVHTEHTDIKSIRGTGNGCVYDENGDLIKTPGDNTGDGSENGGENVVEVVVETMKCHLDGPWDLQLAFSPENKEEDRPLVQYRVFIAHADTPDERIALSDHPTAGWYIVASLRNTSSEVNELISSHNGGYGDAWLYVEKRMPGDSDWTPVAEGKFHTTPSFPGGGSMPGVYCGWTN